MSSLKDQIVGCGCFGIILLFFCIISFVMGGYFGRDFLETVKEKSAQIFTSVADKAEDVGEEVKEAGTEIINEAAKKGGEAAVDEVKKEVEEKISK
ncbi:hypothetical protein AAEX28_08795 [Lentisphaerota bacterium WC36G]|nr:hypothetical protein LJT99_11645 [Lentisphaerae bacterium WC36]